MHVKSIILVGSEGGISADASSPCLFWQKQAFPELRGATPNPRLAPARAGASRIRIPFLGSRKKTDQTVRPFFVAHHNRGSYNRNQAR